MKGKNMTSISRRHFLAGLGLGALGVSATGCTTVGSRDGVAQIKIALQLFSIHKYISNLKNVDGKPDLQTALEHVAAIGYEGVEFAGYYGYDARDLRAMLQSAGLKPCGTHVDCMAFGLDTKTWKYDPEVLKRTCEFNMTYGNTLLINPGGGNFPPGCSGAAGRGQEPFVPSQVVDDHIMRLTEFYNQIAFDAAKLGCRIGWHNHRWEHLFHMQDGISLWDYFFSNTRDDVCMEQDVGWSTCVGVDPKEQYGKYPHRSPTLHAKENGMGKGVKEFDAILGKPGKPNAEPVDWDALIPVARADGVQWFVVECERHFDDLSAVLPSYCFLKSKGLG